MADQSGQSTESRFHDPDPFCRAIQSEHCVSRVVTCAGVIGMNGSKVLFR